VRENGNQKESGEEKTCKESGEEKIFQEEIILQGSLLEALVVIQAPLVFIIKFL